MDITMHGYYHYHTMHIQPQKNGYDMNDHVTHLIHYENVYISFNSYWGEEKYFRSHHVHFYIQDIK